MWRSAPNELEVVAAFSGVPDLRAYVRLHQHLGEPAIRKISRQACKGVSRLSAPLPSSYAGRRVQVL